MMKKNEITSLTCPGQLRMAIQTPQTPQMKLANTFGLTVLARSFITQTISVRLLTIDNQWLAISIKR
jgi:hypothetical protein